MREKIKTCASKKRIPELEHLVQDTTVFELPEHTVTIEPILDSQLSSENVFLGKNEVSCLVKITVQFKMYSLIVVRKT